MHDVQGNAAASATAVSMALSQGAAAPAVAMALGQVVKHSPTSLLSY